MFLMPSSGVAFFQIFLLTAVWMLSRTLFVWICTWMASKSSYEVVVTAFVWHMDWVLRMEDQRK